MQKTVTLAFYGFNYTGMSIADIHASYTRIKINVLVAINVFNYAIGC
jgi:hypothetical protein